MGRSPNKYPSLVFYPSLDSESAITIAAPSRRTLEPRLRWQATLGRDDYDRLRSEKGEVQVWSNYTGDQWLAIPFEERTVANVSTKGVESVHLSIFEYNSETSTHNQISLEASVPLPSPAGRSIEFTYRVVYASGDHSYWLGTPGNNGQIAVPSVGEDDSLKGGSWISVGKGAFLWTSITRDEPVVIAELHHDVKWNGWALKQETTASSDISRFTQAELTSEFAMAGPAVALALFPQANLDSCIAYPPVLYTSTNGTLSLKGSTVFLHPSIGESTELRAYTSTWQECIPHTPAPFDIQTSDFIGIATKNQGDVGYLHILPVTGVPSTITLNLSSIASLVSLPSVVLADSTLHVIKFLLAYSPTDRLRIAVGPAGGEIIVVPAYTLSASISLAFLLQDPGSMAELEPSVDALIKHSSSSQEFTSESDFGAETSQSSHVTVAQTSPQDTSSIPPGIFLLVIRILWELLYKLSTVASKSSSINPSERITHVVQNVEDTTILPRLAFKVTGKAPLLVKGENVSELLILVGGKPLQTTPKEIGGGHWLYEDTSALTIDCSQRRIEIAWRN